MEADLSDRSDVSDVLDGVFRPRCEVVYTPLETRQESTKTGLPRNRAYE